MSVRSNGKRILMLGPLGPPHVSDQVLALARRGFDLHVGGNAPHELDDAVIQDAGVPVHASPSEARSTPWGIAATVRWTRALIREVAPDVVSAHWLPGFGFAAAAAGAAPLALTAWGSDVYQAGVRMRLASRYAIRRADLVMADSTDLIDRCGLLGAPADRLELIQWGVSLQTFYPAEDRAALKRELGLGPGPVILSPRSLMPVYNIPTITEAFGEIGNRFADAQLVIKHMGFALMDLPDLPHSDRVHVVGSVPYERMADYYRAADVVVSVPSSDGAPRSVWEAMACATPVIVSDLVWTQDLLVSDEHALTVPVKDSSALAEAITQLIEAPGLALKIGDAGRALVEAKFDRERHMDRLADLLDAIGRSG